MKYSNLFIYFLILLTGISCQPIEKQEDYLVILSLDGFRWDYAERANTPVLDSLAQAGVVAESLKPCFPTKTFPNHYSIATGLYPDHHGLVNNNFFAPELGKFYRISNREAVENGDFYNGEPIWVTAEKQQLKSATLFWVGSEARIKGYQPSIWHKYDQSLPFEARIDSVYRWLSLPDSTRPHLVMWYYYQPDDVGHQTGPYSSCTRAMTERLDSLLGLYFTKMRALPDFSKMNFIVTSDHGMTDLSEERAVVIDEYIDTADIAFYTGSNPIFNIKAKEGRLESLYRKLKEAHHLFVWKNDSMPARFHYGNNPRTLDLTVVAYPGWSIVSDKKRHVGKGTHGYDNEFKDMHAIFYAAGPAFKKGITQPTFENVDIYLLATKILGLTPATTDGKEDRITGMLN